VELRVAAVGAVFFGVLPDGEAVNPTTMRDALENMLRVEIGIHALSAALMLLLPRRANSTSAEPVPAASAA
jgi:hypothetical protein